MSESEFDIINAYFSEIGGTQDWLITGVGDDAAVLATAPEQQLVIAIDTLNTGVHFAETTPAFEVGYKALAVNISDIAAMGGQPTWFTLSLSLPEVDHDWLRGFSEGLASLANEYHLNLVGGDTTRGPLSITVQIAGSVPVGKALYRSGAKIGDDIYVTGMLGDAAAGLKIIKQPSKTLSPEQQALVHRLEHPIPRVDVGLALRDIATSCIDISDGLTADLGHILDASQVGAEIERDKIPLSKAISQIGLEPDKQYELALHGGDDYELCFTAPKSKREEIETISRQTNCDISRLGTIIQEQRLFVTIDGQRASIDKIGYDHFIKS